jgi:hypothetical protein
MLHDLQNLDEVKPTHYEPDSPQASHKMQQVRLVTIIVLVILVLLIALGFVAQFAHNAIH